MESSAVRRMGLRELTVLARERLGARAAELKTRDELVAALFGPPAPAAPPAPRVVVTRDFFVPAQR
jgi:hypothetical protein